MYIHTTSILSHPLVPLFHLLYTHRHLAHKFSLVCAYLHWSVPPANHFQLTMPVFASLCLSECIAVCPSASLLVLVCVVPSVLLLVLICVVPSVLPLLTIPGVFFLL
ncbi:hypothetical protein EDB19DRAFT_1729733 [Suillus lakei]|nr:hypothetical protein EDB19DRAFT_1729733 [Suillus lakei]